MMQSQRKCLFIDQFLGRSVFHRRPLPLWRVLGVEKPVYFRRRGIFGKKKHVKTSIRVGKIGYRYGYPRDYLPLQLSVKLVGRHRTLPRGRNNRNNRIVDTLISFIHKLRTHNRMEIVWWTAPANAGSLSVSSIQVCQNNETQS